MFKFLFKLFLGHIYRHHIQAIELNPSRCQERFFEHWKKGINATAIANTQPHNAFLDLESFKSNINITDYDNYRETIEKAIKQDGDSHLFDLFEHRKTRHFGHSSTSKKYIPFTKKMIRCFKHYQNTVLAHIVNAQPQTNLNTYVFLCGLNIEHRNRINLGYSTAIMLDLNPWLIQRMTKPSLKTLKHEDFHEKIDLLEEEFIKSRPDTLSGLPEITKGLLLHFLERPRKAEILNILKGVVLYCWSGNYITEEDELFFRTYCSPNLVIFDVCSATEGPIGYSTEKPGLFAPALQHNLFLFLDSDNNRYFSWELKPNERYSLTMTNYTGLMAYQTGDTIEVIQQNPLRFKLLPTHDEYNLLKKSISAPFTDFYLHMDSKNCLHIFLETNIAPNTIKDHDSLSEELKVLARQLGASKHIFRPLKAGTISKASYHAGHQGMIKLKRFQKNEQMHNLWMQSLDLYTTF